MWPYSWSTGNPFVKSLPKSARHYITRPRSVQPDWPAPSRPNLPGRRTGSRGRAWAMVDHPQLTPRSAPKARPGSNHFRDWMATAIVPATPAPRLARNATATQPSTSNARPESVLPIAKEQQIPKLSSTAQQVTTIAVATECDTRRDTSVAMVGSATSDSAMSSTREVSTSEAQVAMSPPARPARGSTAWR